MKLIRAYAGDSERIWKMQRDAFKDLYEKYQDHDTNPANEEMQKMTDRLNQDYTYYYFISAEDVIVGAIRVVDKNDHSSKRISPLFILEKYRRKGYARQAILEVESIHGHHNWELETILEEKGNYKLYESLGYTKTGKTEKINDKMTLVYYKKN